MDPHDEFQMTCPPTAAHPLLGLTILLVEDSRFACEAFRLMAQHSGARLRRADTLQHARQHLRTYRPSVIIIDLGLPDGYGEGLIADLARSKPRIQTILATSGDPDGEMRSVVAGADGFLQKPLSNIAYFQDAILSRLPKDKVPTGPRSVKLSRVTPDPLAYLDDLTHIGAVLSKTPDKSTLNYVIQFLTGVTQSAGDNDLFAATVNLSKAQQCGKQYRPYIDRITDLIAARTTPGFGSTIGRSVEAVVSSPLSQMP